VKSEKLKVNDNELRNVLSLLSYRSGGPTSFTEPFISKVSSARGRYDQT
jgi:hypothetical protein